MASASWVMADGVPTGNQLADWHTAEFSRVADLYDGQNPTRLSTYVQRQNWLQGEFSAAHRQQLAAALRPFMEQTGASAASLANLDRLMLPGATAVVTGQQAGLFLGPLYSLSKALTAIGTAKRLQADLGMPVIPVFWIASEDHDWAEVNHAWVLGADDAARRIALPQRPGLHQMVHHTPLQTDSVSFALLEAYRQLPDGPEKPRVFDWLRGSWSAGDSLATWFARLMNDLFAHHGLVVLDPCLPPLRAMVADVWQKTIAQRDDLACRLDSAYSEVIAAGATPEVVRDPVNALLFHVHQGGRYVLERAGTTGRLRTRGLNIERSADEWRALSGSDPTQFSSNVLLRPVVQDHLLPVLAYVGGPSEIAYHALSRAVFHGHGRQLPPLVLRQRMTFWSGSVRRVVNAHGWTRADLRAPQDLATPLLERNGRREIAELSERMRRESELRWLAYGEQIKHLGPQVSGMVAAQIRRDWAMVHRVELKARRLLERQHLDDLRQLRHVSQWLWPNGVAQERRLCALNLWIQQGTGWIANMPAWDDYQRPGPVLDVEM